MRKFPFPLKPSLETERPIVLTIHTTLDSTGLMKVSISGNPPPNVTQVMTAMVDTLKGYMDGVNKHSSMIINPNKTEKILTEESDATTQEENNHNG